TTSSGSATRSRVVPSTNSPGWRMNGSSSDTSISSVRSSIRFLTSMNGYRLLANTRNWLPTRRSIEEGCTESGSNGSITSRPSSISFLRSRSEKIIPCSSHHVAAQVGEPGELGLEGELHHALRTGTVLGNVDLGDAPALHVLGVVVVVTVDEHHDVGVLLDGAGLTEVGEAGPLVLPLLQRPVELG